MADNLYLSLWFPSFSEAEMMPRALGVLKQFPFSAEYSGIGYLAVRAISWNEPVIFEETFAYPAGPEAAVSLAAEFLHDDYAYEFDAMWDLWAPGESEQWIRQARPVRLLAMGLNFDDGAYKEDGHIQVNFGLDTPFLYEDVRLTPLAEARVRENVQQLVAFTSALEKNCGIAGRLLWSESEENLAQKLIARLQMVQ